MDNRVKVSVVIPIYNVEEYLEEVLDSLVCQTLDGLEFICVNDGSTDSSLDIINKFAVNDERFKVISQENGGYGKAVNRGIDEAKGEYLAILESDDFIPPNMYEVLYEKAKENNVDLIKADFYRFKYDESIDDYRYVYKLLDTSLKYYDRILNVRTDPQVITMSMYTWAGIYNTAFINNNKIRHNETPGASYQDNGFFWQTFLCAERMLFINEALYRYRVDNPNASIKNKNKVYNMNEEHAFIKDYIENNFDDELIETVRPYFIVRQYNAYLETLKRIDDAFKQEYVNRVSAEFNDEYANGYNDVSKLNEKQQEGFLTWMNDPKHFYKKYALSKAERIKKSKTYALGNIIMYVPRKAKKRLSAKREEEEDI